MLYASRTTSRAMIACFIMEITITCAIVYEEEAQNNFFTRSMTSLDGGVNGVGHGAPSLHLF